MIIGCLCYSFGSVMARPMMRTLAPVQMAGLTDLIGGGILLGASLVVEPGAWDALSLDWGWKAWLGWFYLLVPGALISTTIYFLLVRDWGASQTGTARSSPGSSPWSSAAPGSRRSWTGAISPAWC